MTTSTLAGVCRADRAVLHPLSRTGAADLSADLAAEGVPVEWQMAHALRLVTRATDSLVHWAGA